MAGFGRAGEDALAVEERWVWIDIAERERESLSESFFSICNSTLLLFFVVVVVVVPILLLSWFLLIIAN